MTAANLIARSAATMKRDFAPLSKQTLSTCLVGFRTKQPIILAALRAAADASVATVSCLRGYNLMWRLKDDLQIKITAIIIPVSLT